MVESSLLSGMLSSNPYFSAGVGVIGVGTGLAILRKGLLHAVTMARRQLLVTLEIPSRDKSYQWFLQWMSQQQQQQQQRQAKRSIQTVHQYAVETSFMQHDNGSVSTAFSLVPGPGKHFFKWKGVWLQVERQRDTRMLDVTSGSPWETVTLTTLSRDRYVFGELLKEAQRLAIAKQEGKTVIYTSWGSEWRPFGLPRKRRLLDSVILDRGIKEKIVKDVKDFIGNGKWYNDRGIPYRRGYLLYGPPGSGKSSFIQALAGELEYNICILNLAELGLTDDRLNHLMSNAPQRSIILLEDIDAAFNPKRFSTITTTEQQQKYSGSHHHHHTMVTFSGLLNALDGVASSEERIIFMTTNHLEYLDSALIRPGRVDVKELFDNASDYQIRNMFLRFYEMEDELANEFVKRIEGKDVSTAQLQGHFVYYKNDAKAAVENSESVMKNW